MTSTSKAVLCCVAAAVLAAPVASAAPASAATPAPGCTDSNPTSLGGEAVGSDGRSINALIGIDLRDATGKPVNVNGQPIAGGYGKVVNVNRTFPATGADSSLGVRRWGATDANGNATGSNLCVAANVARVYVETYPRTRDATTGAEWTDKTRYGGGSRYGVPLTAGAHVEFAADLPLRYDQGGITGDVVGKISYNRQPVTEGQITRMRAFSTDAGPSCEPGISGFSAHLDALTAQKGGKASDYLLGHLAGGRCGATSQSYTLYVDCTCGGSLHTLSAAVRVTAGVQTAVNWAFSSNGDSVTVQ